MTAEGEVTGRSWCVLCGDAAWVVVLHPRDCGRDGPTGGRTLAVVCFCHRGRTLAEKHPDAMTLEQYRGRWPRGEEYLRWVEEENLLAARHASRTGGDEWTKKAPGVTPFDPAKLDDVLATLAERFGLPRETINA